MKNKILILCGKSASGKDYIEKKLVTEHNFKPIVSWTSRPKRENETEGVEYHFCTKKEFEHMIKKDMFIEHRTYNTLVNGIADIWYYGLLKEELENKNYVVILDLKGARDFVKYYGNENCRVVYINSDKEVRTKRAMNRGSFDKTEWERRLKADEEDFSTENIANSVVEMIMDNNENTNIENIIGGILYEF